MDKDLCMIRFCCRVNKMGEHHKHRQMEWRGHTPYIAMGCVPVSVEGDTDLCAESLVTLGINQRRM